MCKARARSLALLLPRTSTVKASVRVERLEDRSEAESLIDPLDAHKHREAHKAHVVEAAHAVRTAQTRRLSKRCRAKRLQLLN